MTAHVFLRYVDPDREHLLELLGFRKFVNEIKPPIWKLNEVLLPDNPLHDMDTEQVSAYMRELGIAGQIYEAEMWGLCPD